MQQKKLYRFLPYLLLFATLTVSLLLLNSYQFTVEAKLAEDVLTDHTAPPVGVALVGDLQTEIGCAGDWTPDCATSELIYDEADDVWQGKFALPVGNYEYKVALNDSWDESYGTPPDGGNISISVTVASTVTFYYDHKNHWVTDNLNEVIATVPGSYQTMIGCPGDWDPGCLRTWLQDPDGNGVYTFTTIAMPGDFEGKVAINESWDENYGVGGVAGDGDNYTFTVVNANSPLDFAYDHVSHLLTITVGAGDSVALVGDLQTELGCADDWDPACDATGIAYFGNQVWRDVFTLAAGDWQYKIALNDTWDESYSGNHQNDDGNTTISLTDTTAVNFYYDHKTHAVLDSVMDDIAVATGSLQDELGCSAEWQPECVNTLMTDVDGDGIYVFETDMLPVGSYEFKVAFNEAWGNGEVPADNVSFSVAAEDSTVTITWNDATDDVTVDVALPFVLEPVIAPPPRHPIQGDVFYFVMPDRFANADTSNDQGGLTGDELVHGFDPTNSGFYHGGDLAGLLDKLDYLQGMGVTAIWMTPMFKNQPVQGEGDNVSAAYHGYWITDFTQFDPHFGTNDELELLITEAHSRSIKIFFDIITNHTADIIDYEEGKYGYVSKEDFPYRDADGNEFDDRNFINDPAFPELDAAVSFPYTPFVPDGRPTMVPELLNDVPLYHNRGNSTFVQENSLYGDFYGLDDIFTERHEVVDGMIDIYKDWVDFGVDGFRIDTVKHVNAEFWMEFAPAILEHAHSIGNDDFFFFGEVYSGNPELLSFYSTRAYMPATLDFHFQEAVDSYVLGGTSDNLQNLFNDDDYYIDANSNAYMLPTFVGNHDMGRIGYFIQSAGITDDAEMLARSKLAHAMMYFARGIPVIYYGDEQGFIGTGGDKAARQDMFASQVTNYIAEDMIGTDANPGDDNFDNTHPLYTAYAEYADIYQTYPALQYGAQIHRYSVDAEGIYAFSRIDRDEQIEYIVAFNNADEQQTVMLPTYQPADAMFTVVYPPNIDLAIMPDANGQITATVPALDFVIYTAGQPLPMRDAAPNVTITNLSSGDEIDLEVQTLDGTRIVDRLEVVAELDETVFAEVTFAVRPSDSDTPYIIAGVDDNPPYRIFLDPNEQQASSAWLTGTLIAPGTPLDILVTVNDFSGDYNTTQVLGIVANVVEPEPPAEGDFPHAVIHYARDDGDYGDHTTGDYNDYWGLHMWGDGIDGSIEWTAPIPFSGEDDYGRFAWICLTDASKEIGFIVHQGDTKDIAVDRFFSPAAVGAEIWLKSSDETYYDSQAAAQGYVTFHYTRTDGIFDDWGLHLWQGSWATEWGAPHMTNSFDDFGAVYSVSVEAYPDIDFSQPLNFIMHNGDDKDPGPDMVMNPAEHASVWLVSGDETIHPTRGSAENYTTVHYNRSESDYGDYSSNDYNDFWGMHAWGDILDGPDWAVPLKPVFTDTFGVAFRVNMLEETTSHGYILHRGDDKDPGTDQNMDTAKYGFEVWQLQGADPEAPYLLPIIGEGSGPSGDVNLDVPSAYWLSEDTIAMPVEYNADNAYYLFYAPEGGMVVADDVITGASKLDLTYNPAGLPSEITDKFPHLASLIAFNIITDDLASIPEILKGQIAVAEYADGKVFNGMGLQIPGVLDDLYTYDGELGVVYNGDVPTLRLWAPTAKSVKLHLFDTSTVTQATQVLTMTNNENGTWEITGDNTWTGKFYIYEIEVYVHATGQVEHNMVTDPYAVSLSMNSRYSQIIDLANDETLMPDDWADYDKPELEAIEDITIYEMHIRDFSIFDETVAETYRGKYMAFTENDTDGMNHLQALQESGLTHLHLLPAFDIATINEDVTEQVNLTADEIITFTNAPMTSTVQQQWTADNRMLDGFNWGYDPFHYNVPEGSYATDPDGSQRILEFREMVKGLNDMGLRVVMDVVYNHTNASGQNERSVLDKVVPGYYHRLDEAGVVATSTCCQNTASEHNMMRKLMIDSVVMWAKLYKVDAFRFDLMGHHMKTDMVELQAAIENLTLENDGVDGSKIYIYGEGWNFGEVGNNQRGENATQANLAGTGIGTFSDRLRDAVRGGGPFDTGESRTLNQGFISGLLYDMNEDVVATVPLTNVKNELFLSADQIRLGLAGNLAEYIFMGASGEVISGSQVDYNGSPAGYGELPREHIVYISKHDNETLYDITQYKMPMDSTMDERVRAHNMGLSIVSLSQGIPFLHAGSDMLRSKSMDRDSYDSGDWFNRLDWTYQTNNWGIGLPPSSVGGQADQWGLMAPYLGNTSLKPTSDDIIKSVHHLREMLAIRKSSDLFHLATLEEVQAAIDFHNTGPDQIPGLIAMTLIDEDETIVVLFNANNNSQTLTLSDMIDTDLVLHPVQAEGHDSVVKTSSFDKSTGMFSIPARTTAVFVLGEEEPIEPISIPIDPVAGGVISDTNGNLNITIPPGVLPITVTNLQYTPLGITPAVGTANLPSDTDFVLVFDLTFVDANGNPVDVDNFTEPITVTISYSQSVIDERNLDEKKLKVYYLISWQWSDSGIAIVGEVDDVNNKITFTVNHLTQFAVNGTKKSIEPDEYFIYLPIILKTQIDSMGRIR